MAYKSGGRGNYILEFQVKEIGRIRRASGAYTVEECERRRLYLKSLVNAGQFDLLRALRDGLTSIPELCGAMRQHRAGIVRRTKPRTQIYFIEMVGASERLVKVGIAWDVERRLRGLQSAVPYELRLMRAVSGDVSKERAILRRFADARVRGEWFHAVPELLAFLREQAHLDPWQWS